MHEHSGGIPRRINRLCARVLLAGTLEHATVMTAELVSVTAEELTQDLGAICAEAPPPRGAEDGAEDRARCVRLPSTWASSNEERCPATAWAGCRS